MAFFIPDLFESLKPVSSLAGKEAELARALKRHVEYLSSEIGERNVFNGFGYEKAAQYIEDSLSLPGIEVSRQVVDKASSNVVGHLAASYSNRPPVVIGAHYDSVVGSPGADDNASGVAGLLCLAKSFSAKRLGREMYFVAFANEEPPFFQTSRMGSYVFAKGLRQRGFKVSLMISLETMGYFSTQAQSQRYPFPLGFFYPLRGDFIGFVSRLKDFRLLRKITASFRESTMLPVESGALPAWMPVAGLSDHWSFWQFNYPAIMATDTAMFRYPYYHGAQDTSDKLDYQRLSQVVLGLEAALRKLSERKQI